MGGPRKYNTDESFFSHPDPVSCYWAGFIAADGSIGTGPTVGTQLSIACKLSDITHLSYFRDAIAPDKPVMKYTNTKYPYCKFTVNSRRVIDDLSSIYNIGPRKSLTLVPPNISKRDHIIAFIIGYIDGDGCITKNGLTIRMVGTEPMLLWIKAFMDENYPARWGRGTGMQRNRRSPLTLEYNFGAGRASGLLDCISRYNLPILSRKWGRVRTTVKSGLRAVCKICPTTGRVLETYKSLTEAGRNVDRALTNIIVSIKSGRTRRAGGYFWEYSDHLESNAVWS